jgi:hypothetical protein
LPADLHDHFGCRLSSRNPGAQPPEARTSFRCWFGLHTTGCHVMKPLAGCQSGGSPICSPSLTVTHNGLGPRAMGGCNSSCSIQLVSAAGAAYVAWQHARVRACMHNCIHDHSGCRLSSGRGPLPQPRELEPISDAGLDCILENGSVRQPQGSWHLFGG